MEYINVSSMAIEKYIVKLKKYGILKIVGPDKGGFWQIIKHTKFWRKK